MPKYTFTQQDRSKGGKTTASRYNMKARGLNGLFGLAVRYFDGDVKRAGETLSKIGLWRTDPARWNGAWRFPKDCPPALKELVMERWGNSTDGVPF